MLSAKPLGMHISAIRKFQDDHPTARTEDLTTSQCNRQFVKAESQGTGKPFINLYDRLKNKQGKPLVAPATVFVSHAWKYPFASTVADVMEQHTAVEPDAYFWFDLFTNDQNAVANKDFDWFCNTFKGSIRAIGQVLLVLSPWNDPLPVRRAWCLFEIANAIAESKVKFTINLPTSQIESMSSAVLKDSECLVQALTDIQAEKADATSKDDLKMIFDVIEKSDGGFSYVNEQVKKSLRSWYMGRLRELLQKKPDEKELILSTAHIAHDFGFIDEAIKYAEKGLKIAEKPNAGDPYRMTIFSTAGNIFRTKGQLGKAVELHSKSLSLKLKAFGENHASVAATYTNLGNVAEAMGDVAKAMMFYNKSLAIKKATVGKDSADAASTLTNMGTLCSSKGQFDKAVEYFNQALAIQEKTLGDKHPTVGMTLTNLGDVYMNQNKMKQALECLERSIKIKLPALGESHPSVAASYNNLANLYSKQGQHNKALEYYNKAIPIRVAALGENHTDIGGNYNNMANAYYGKREYAKAIQYFEKALKIYQASNPNHPLIGHISNNMATAYRANGNPDKAAECLKKAMKVATASGGGENSQAMMATYTNQASQHYQRKEYDKAIEFYGKSIEIQKSIFGEKHPAVANTYYNIANAYFRKGDADNAIEYFTKAIPIHVTVQGPNHPDVASCYNNMSHAYRAKGEMEKAMDCYQKAEAIRAKK